MLCVADYLDALEWIESIGGLSGAITRSEANLAVIRKFVNDTLAELLAQDPETVSNTSVCLSLDVRVQSKLKRSLNCWRVSLLPST